VLAAAGGNIRVQASGDLAGPVPRAILVLDVVVIVGTLVSWTAWLAIQIPTYRHASGEHRQQLKWLHSGAAIFVVSAIIGVFIIPLAAGEAPGWGTQPGVTGLTTLGAAALPVCMGVAVLKYRLYELNRVISRVVSYTLITALLGGVFIGLILLATHVLPFRAPVAVAMATLVIAALFNPLRRRLQHAVDCRFNRARYDAGAVVGAFTARLRRTIDLDAIRAIWSASSMRRPSPPTCRCGCPPPGRTAPSRLPPPASLTTESRPGGPADHGAGFSAPLISADSFSIAATAAGPALCSQ